MADKPKTGQRTEIEKCPKCQRWVKDIKKEGCPEYEANPNDCPCMDILEEFYTKPVIGKKTTFSFKLGNKNRPNINKK